jgi:hypothetical protein
MNRQEFQQMAFFVTAGWRPILQTRHPIDGSIAFTCWGTSPVAASNILLGLQQSPAPEKKTPLFQVCPPQSCDPGKPEL